MCLGGTLQIATRAPHADEWIAEGGNYAIASKTGRRISNGGEEDDRFLPLQGVGRYNVNRIGN